ncbi:MAG: Hsp20/alpha crystallin family protein [Bacteroidetes bacterium]|nr:Hsp20/alpha crystallin family protein [Bacteroidota bacterium]
MTNVNFNKKPFEGTLNNLVDSFFTELPTFLKNEIGQPLTKGSVPVNVKETAGSYVMEVVAPGFEKSDFSLNLDQNLLTISAEKNTETKETTEKQIRSEYNYRSFKRSFTIDEKIDATKIEASYINGVLMLTLPKKEEVKQAATQIQIK